MKRVSVILVLLSIFFIIGCSIEDQKTPTAISNPLILPKVVISISAEGEETYVPYWGECKLWAVHQPVANPPPQAIIPYI